MGLYVDSEMLLLRVVTTNSKAPFDTRLRVFKESKLSLKPHRFINMTQYSVEKYSKLLVAL